MAVRSTVYATGEGKGNILSYEKTMQLAFVPEIDKVNEGCETPPVKTTDHYSKLCKEYNNIVQGIDQLKCVQVKLHIDETVQSVQDRNILISCHIRDIVQKELYKPEQLDIIQEVVDAPTTRMSPIVPEPKSKKPSKLREILCFNIREAKTAIVRELHVTPTIYDIISELNSSPYFTKLDLNKEYHQVSD